MKLKHIFKILCLLIYTQTYSYNSQLLSDSLRLDILENQSKQLINELKALKSQNIILLDSVMIFRESLLLNENIISEVSQNIDSIQSYIKNDILISLNDNKNEINDNYFALTNLIDPINIKFDTINSKLITVNDRLNLTNIKTSKNNSEINELNQIISVKQQNYLIILVSIIILILMLYIILNKKNQVQTKKLLDKHKSIFENQISDSQKISDWLQSHSEDSFSVNNSENIDHSFVKKVANELVRISQNLSRMDSEIRGHKKLVSSVGRLERSLKMNGYEMKKLLNERYDSGMNVDPIFITDENLKAGESIITSVIKPQINYKGEIIQIAQIEVTQSE